MTLIVPPGFGLAAFTFSGAPGTAPYVTTMGTELDLGEVTAVQAANNIKFHYADNLMPRTSNQLTLDRVQLYVGQDGPSGSVDSDTPPVTGGRTGNFPPTAQSLIARKVTSNLGRRGRGRMFIPGILEESEVEQTGGITSASRTLVNGLLTGFIEDWGLAMPGVGQPVLFHSSAPADPTPIEGLVAADLVGWIRGRIR